MANIYQYTDKIDIKNIILYTPKAVQGGGYYAKIKLNDSDLYIQTPKIKTKNGITITGKKVYSDLLFEREHLDFIDFISNIEKRIIENIMSKGGLWFTEEPTQEDIENRWNSCIRRYKKNKNLIRTNIERKINSLDLKIWDNDENKLEEKDITLDDDIIAIFQITGLKFSSTSFQIDLSLKQVMKFNNKEIFSKCLIKVNNNIIEKNDIKIKNDEIKKNNNNEKESYDDNRDDNSEDDNSEDDNSEDDNSEDDNSEDNNSEYDNSEDDNSEGDNNDEDNNDEDNNDEDNKDEDNKDEDNKDEDNKDESKEEIEKNLKKENNNMGDENNNTGDENNSMEDKNNIKNKKKETDLLEGNLKNYIKDDSLEKNILEEVTLEISDNVDIIKLKNPKDVYLDIYNKALIKARKAKKDAIHAYLEAKKIKKTYLLDDIESSDGEDLDNFSD